MTTLAMALYIIPLLNFRQPSKENGEYIKISKKGNTTFLDKCQRFP